MDDKKNWDGQTTALGHLKEHLEHARMAELVFAPVSGEARALAQHLTSLTLEHEAKTSPRTRKRQGKAQKSFEAAVGAFAADLIHHSQFEEAGGFMYRLSDKDLMAETLVSVRSFEKLLAFWPAMGLMEQTSFFRAHESWEDVQISVFLGRAKRFRATGKLLNIGQGFGINTDNVKTHFMKQTGRTSPVTIRSELPTRNGKGLQAQNMKLPGPTYDRERERVEEINSILATGGFDLGETPRIYRLFHRGNFPDFAFNMGGRLYCRSEDNWQQMNKPERAKITCDGEPTVELDVRASHLFILYALHGMGLSAHSDPYEIAGIPRDIVKGLFAAICGRGGRPTRWPKKMAEEFLKKTGKKLSEAYKLGSVLDKLYETHPVLRRIEKNKLDWAKLQYEESECFMSCLQRLGREHGIAALPVHDSLIVAQRDRDIAKLTLKDAYQARFGFFPVIRET